MFEDLISFIRDQYKTKEAIPLHAPLFAGSEKDYVNDAIDSSFVSSIGQYVNDFENALADYVGMPKAVACVNGTSALHIALLCVGVKPKDLVITQPLSFVATCNAIHYCNAQPVFIDVSKDRLSLSPQAMEDWLNENSYMGYDGLCHYKKTHQVIRACLPVHVFGHPCEMDGLLKLCKTKNLALIEDAAESLGSEYKGQQTGSFGKLSAISFNGNKIITSGGGGMILTNQELGVQAKHLTTTAKLPDKYKYHHDEIGYNYRLPNLNAALGLAQFNMLQKFLTIKRALAINYAEFLNKSDLQFVHEPKDAKSNFWLNAVICEDEKTRDDLLIFSHENGVMMRPVWDLMTNLPMFKDAIKGPLDNAEWLEKRLVNLPSSVPSLDYK